MSDEWITNYENRLNGSTFHNDIAGQLVEKIHEFSLNIAE